MAGTVLVEIVGLKNAECCPFPCDENRTCGLTGCYPSGKLDTSYEELKRVLNNEYGTRVETKLTIIDNGTPEYIRSIIEAEYPAAPHDPDQWADYPDRPHIAGPDKKRD